MVSNRAWPNVAIAPGELLAEELEARKLSQRELAKRMGRPVQVINEIVLGKKRITAETALQLEEVLETPADFWLNLEAGYQLAKARIVRSKRRRQRPARVSA